ncbi:hypothetical protein BpHYR1_003270 [Brachionus plicatilis]|uniref:Uncharacterized protein n=1 Tax=Brachionus plicatilis TaxID=10195 RepID=A0A3M7R9U9_BRAPC|nr:hypothetical protein BpHYR1_003270 [Brachionus plicatilis]
MNYIARFKRQKNEFFRFKLHVTFICVVQNNIEKIIYMCTTSVPSQSLFIQTGLIQNEIRNRFNNNLKNLKILNFVSPKIKEKISVK